jgi:hypothetical protein
MAYVEQQNEVTISSTGVLTPVNNATDTIKLFLCPSRGIRSGQASPNNASTGPFGGISDYGYYILLPANVAGQQCILWNPVSGVTLEQVSNASGTGATALLSHLGVNPAEYGYGPTTWYNCNNAQGGTSVRDNQFQTGAYLTPNSYFPQGLSSPHADVNLVLFADAHVQPVVNSWLTANQNVWSWENTTALQVP